MSAINAQTKLIRRKLFARGALVLVVVTVVFIVIMQVVGRPMYKRAAYKFAEAVSPWEYVDESEFIDLTFEHGIDYELMYQSDAEQPENEMYISLRSTDGESFSWSSTDISTAVEESADGSADTAASGETESNGMSVADGIAFWTNGERFAWRDLTPYYNFLAAREAVFVLMYAALALVVLLALLVRSTRYVNELTEAVAGLYRTNLAPPKLSNDLAVVHAEIVDLQARADADARAVQVAEQRKNDLVAYLAHDIRTPLTSVIGYLELLNEAPELPAAQRARYTNIVYEKALRLEGLVEEFFDITRYNLNCIPIEREQVVLRVFCEQVAEEFYPVAEPKSIEVVIEAPADEVAFIDPGKMARAVGNVMRNALTFAAPGTQVVLHAGHEGGQVVISVSDTGKEISEAHLASIFEKFFREDSARSAESGGTGLGLAIAKEIVEAHGGKIGAVSENGVTTFTITLPA